MMASQQQILLPAYTPFLDYDTLTDKNNLSVTRKYYPTNNVLKHQNKKKKIIYLPAFLRLKFKNFNDMDIGGLSALLNGEIILVIYYGELFEVFGNDKEKEIEECLMKKVVLLFARDNAIKLTNNKDENDEKELDIKVSHDPQRHEVKFIVKKIFKLYLDSDVFCTPFQVINGILEVTVQPVELMYPKAVGNKKFLSRQDKNQRQEWKIQFNLQNNWNINEKVQFANWGTFGNYDLAEKRIGALYTNYRISEAADFKMTVQQRIQNQKEKKRKAQIQSGSEQIIKEIEKKYITNDPIKQIADFQKSSMIKISQSQKDKFIIDIEQKQAKIQAFHYAYFNVPLYKYPLPALITIFVPLFFLDVLNFGILFQDKTLSDRIAAIATLVLAFAALIPTIRSQIPPNPKITLIQGLVYFQTVPTLLAIFQSLNVNDLFQPDSEESFVFDWIYDGFFWVAFSISVVTFLIIFILVIIHYCKWYPEYNDVAERSKKLSFNRTRWRNTECNKYFDEYFTQERDNKQTPTAVILKQKNYKHWYSIEKKTVKKIQKLLKKEQVAEDLMKNF